MAKCGKQQISLCQQPAPVLSPFEASTHFCLFFFFSSHAASKQLIQMVGIWISTFPHGDVAQENKNCCYLLLTYFNLFPATQQNKQYSSLN